MNFNLDKYVDVKYRIRTSCVVCGELCNNTLIELPDFPITEIFVESLVTKKAGYADQVFNYCQNCGHGQINNLIDPAIIYDGNYHTRTSTSQSGKDANDRFIEFIKETLPKDEIDTIVEIGCNDLYLLNNLTKKAKNLVGIDPILSQEMIPEKSNIRIITDFIENVNFKENNINCDVVICSHTLEHIDDPRKTLELLLQNANENSTFYFQFPSLELLVKNGRFDQVFHQHFNYFTLNSVQYLLNELGAELVSYKYNPYHYGTIMISFRKAKTNSGTKLDGLIIKSNDIVEQYNFFKQNMELAGKRIEYFKDDKLYGFGAALMLPVLFYHIKQMNLLECIIDDDPGKKDMYYLNLPTQIKNSESLGNFKNSVIVVTAISAKQSLRAITKRLIDLNVKEIIIPLNMI